MTRKILPFLSLILFASVTILNAQIDERAQNILNQVSEFYSEKKTIKTEFSVNILNRDAGVDEVHSGNLLIKGNKYRLESDELIRVSDGYAIWTHFINNEELEITEFDPEEEELTPAKIFSIYKEGFTYSFNKEYEENGRRYFEVDLLPEDTESTYSKIRLSLSEENYSIEKAIAYGTNGTIMTFKLKNSNYNMDLNDSIFIFNTDLLSPDIEITDLR